MQNKEVVEMFKKFKDLDKRKLSLTISELKDYLNIKKRIHELGYSLDEVRRLNTDEEMLAYIESRNILKEEVDTEEQVIDESVEPIAVMDIDNEENLDNKITIKVEENENDKEEQVEIEEKEDVLTLVEDIENNEKEEVDTEVKENENIVEDTIQEVSVIENTNDKNEVVKTDTVIPDNIDNTDDTKREEEKDELKDLIQENIDDIVEEVKKLKKKVAENVVEITTGKNLSLVATSNKIKITIPKNYKVNIQHSLLLELYNEVFGLKEEEIEQIEQEENVNELQLGNVVEEETKEQTISEQPVKIEETKHEEKAEIVSTKPENIEDKKEVNREEIKQIEEPTETKKVRKSRKCMKVPTGRIYIAYKDFGNEIETPEGDTLEEKTAKILGLEYNKEKNQICKPEHFDITKITAQQLYQLRAIGIKFKGIKYMISKLMNTTEDKAQEELHKILENEPDEKIIKFFGKKKLREIRGLD